MWTFAFVAALLAVRGSLVTSDALPEPQIISIENGSAIYRPSIGGGPALNLTQVLADTDNVTVSINASAESDGTDVGLPKGYKRFPPIAVPGTQFELILTMNENSLPIPLAKLWSILDETVLALQLELPKGQFRDYVQGHQEGDPYFYLAIDQPQSRRFLNRAAVACVKDGILPWLKARREKGKALHEFQFYVHELGTNPYWADGGLIRGSPAHTSLYAPGPTSMPATS